MNMNNSVTFDKGFWKSFGWFLLIALVICSLPWILATHSLCIDFTDTGQIGDTIGGIMGPFVAIAAAVLTFIAFWVQYKANIQQRHDIAIERFESSVFELLHLQQEITSNLEIGVETGQAVVMKHGRDVFKTVYQEIKTKYFFKDGSDVCTLKKALQMNDELKLLIPTMRHLWFLDHYYRHLYRIFKYIDDVDSSTVSQSKKKEFASIVRATLSAYELVMLYYNGLSHPKFKKLIEKYAILNNLQWNLLADYEDRRDVYEELWKETKANQETLGCLSKEYEKSAFVLN